MDKMTLKTVEADMEASEHELHRLISWAKENPEDWSRICSPENPFPDITYIADLIERLYKEKLLTVIYFTLHTHYYEPEVNWVITRTMNECVLGTPITALMDRFRKNLDIRVRERMAEKE